MKYGDSIALYTTIYPGVEKYLKPWYQSVLSQSDNDFDIYIGLDGMEIDKVKEAIGVDLDANWVIASKEDTPAMIREKAIRKMLDNYRGIVFVDSDDLLERNRIKDARVSLEKYGLTGCSMRIINEAGIDIGVPFTIPPGADIYRTLIRNNVYGLSNTTYRTDILKHCLPIPNDCVLVDWFLAMRAMINGGNLSFDKACGMAYRQHSNNIARVIPPFTPQQVIMATNYVLGHYSCLLNAIREIPPNIQSDIENANEYIYRFREAITNSKDLLDVYVNSLNKLSSIHLWWDFVAHSQLEEVWLKK